MKDVDFPSQIDEIITFAFVTPDGEWIEPEETGWRGMRTSTRDSQKKYDNLFKRYLNKADPEWTMTIVDCHI